MICTGLWLTHWIQIMSGVKCSVSQKKRMRRVLKREIPIIVLIQTQKFINWMRKFLCIMCSISMLNKIVWSWGGYRWPQANLWGIFKYRRFRVDEEALSKRNKSRMIHFWKLQKKRKRLTYSLTKVWTAKYRWMMCLKKSLSKSQLKYQKTKEVIFLLKLSVKNHKNWVWWVWSLSQSTTRLLHQIPKNQNRKTIQKKSKKCLFLTFHN